MGLTRRQFCVIMKFQNKNLSQKMVSMKGRCVMYTQDKTHRITLRLNDEQFEHVTRNAKVMGVSPSELLRIFINVSIASEKYPDAVEKTIGNFSERDGAGRENDKTDIDDKL